MVERTFELPDLGEGIAEGELVSWAVAPGDRVEEDQIIAEVETDKALVEVPSPYDGVVTELHAEEGEVVPVDSVIVTFDVDEEEAGDEASGVSESATEASESAEEGGEDPESESASAPESAEAGGRVFASPSTRALARELDVDLGRVEGSGPGGRVTSMDVERAAESGAVGEASESTDSESTVSGGAEAESEPVLVEGDGERRSQTLAMPATRRLAREEGVDINDVPASEERDGEAFVTPEGVEAYVAAGKTGTEATGGEREVAGASASTGGASGERVPYKGVRKTIGEQMARSKYTAPHVSHHDRLDAKGLVDLRADLAEIAAEEGVKLTYLPFVVKAVTTALQEFPYLNSSLEKEAGEIVLHDEYNIGIAVATDAGLMVPVVKHADQKGLKALASEIRELAEKARNRKISPSEMQGGTFTITNIGVIGGEFSSPIINHPEAAIMAMGPIEKRPWVVDDAVVARETMTLSMSVDHRLVDGAEAAQFSNRVRELLSDPVRLLLD